MEQAEKKWFKKKKTIHYIGKNKYFAHMENPVRIHGKLMVMMMFIYVVLWCADKPILLPHIWFWLHKRPQTPYSCIIWLELSFVTWRGY